MSMKGSFFVCFLLISFLAMAQKKAPDTSSRIDQPNRIEFEMDDYGMDFNLINGEEAGLLVAVETEKRTPEGFNWTFHSLDTLLDIVWTRIYSIPFDSYLAGTEYHNGKYYLLFNVSRYRSQEFLLVEIDALTATHRRIEINTVFPIQLTFFEVIDHNIVFAGYTNLRPVLLTFDLEEQKPRVVPGFYDNNSDILDIIIDDEALMFTVIQQDRMPNRKYTIRAKTFTAAGDLIQTNVITPGDKKNLIDGASTIFYGGFQYMAGTYSKKASQYSRGLYLSKFVNGRQQFVKYHEYADLDNFFGYMNERRQQRIRERIERKRSKGKNTQFSYRLLVHDIIQRGDEYLMIAEAYYPRYSNYSSNVGRYGWNSPARFNPSFMGYQYTHAVVVSFDRNGNIIWDNSFEINDIETFSLEEFVAVSNYEDKTVLMYLEENTIRSKIIQGNEIYEGKTFNPVRLAYVDDEVKTKNPEVEGLKVWYDRAMYAFGEQRIRNENGTGGKISRRVFYINKIQYHLDDKSN
ncbi:hypothetical protein [Marinoscillum luteum]|uniref:GWxTD domain-containing protein n=1 Tax=Marinoscillum luteum TaxID=861051 RepID=A0ABW7N996_9BACT